MGEKVGADVVPRERVYIEAALIVETASVLSYGTMGMETYRHCSRSDATTSTNLHSTVHLRPLFGVAQRRSLLILLSSFEFSTVVELMGSLITMP